MHILFAVYIGVVRSRLPAELVAMLPALRHGDRGRRHNLWVSFDKHHPVNVTVATFRSVPAIIGCRRQHASLPRFSLAVSSEYRNDGGRILFSSSCLRLITSSSVPSS